MITTADSQATGFNLQYILNLHINYRVQLKCSKMSTDQEKLTFRQTDQLLDPQSNREKDI